MSVARNKVDYTIVAYERGNESHQQFIQQEIKQFNLDFNELCNYDKRTGMLSWLLGVAWYFDSISFKGAVTLNTSYSLLSYQFFGRHEYSRQYQNQLNKLLEIYNWCAEKGNISITFDETFLELTKTIISFVEYGDLKKPFADITGASEKFRNLFLQHPLHKNKFMQNEKIAPSFWNGYGYFSGKNEKQQDNSDQQNEQSWGSFYNNHYARARFIFYSRQTSQSKTMVESCKEMVEPLQGFLKLK